MHQMLYACVAHYGNIRCNIYWSVSIQTYQPIYMYMTQLSSVSNDSV
uniref:Uncharacterized protein n=1 Tax=Ciona intestinalis TaxID=7719 RepID=H2XKP0_CIOIN